MAAATMAVTSAAETPEVGSGSARADMTADEVGPRAVATEADDCATSRSMRLPSSNVISGLDKMMCRIGPYGMSGSAVRRQQSTSCPGRTIGGTQLRSLEVMRSTRFEMEL